MVYLFNLRLNLCVCAYVDACMRACVCAIHFIIHIQILITRRSQYVKTSFLEFVYSPFNRSTLILF